MVPLCDYLCNNAFVSVVNYTKALKEVKNEEWQRMQSCFLVKSSQDGIVTFMAL